MENIEISAKTQTCSQMLEKLELRLHYFDGSVWLFVLTESELGGENHLLLPMIRENLLLDWLDPPFPK